MSGGANILGAIHGKRGGENIEEVVKCVCEECGHKEQMFAFFFTKDSKCLNCGGKLLKEGEQREPSEATKRLRDIIAKRR